MMGQLMIVFLSVNKSQITTRITASKEKNLHTYLGMEVGFNFLGSLGSSHTASLKAPRYLCMNITSEIQGDLRWHWQQRNMRGVSREMKFLYLDQGSSSKQYTAIKSRHLKMREIYYM